MTNDDEIEIERLKALDDIEAVDEWLPGTVGCHEALDRTAVLLDTVGLHLLDHPAIVSNKDWYCRVWTIHEDLCELYRVIGSAVAESE